MQNDQGIQDFYVSVFIIESATSTSSFHQRRSERHRYGVAYYPRLYDKNKRLWSDSHQLIRLKRCKYLSLRRLDPFLLSVILTEYQNSKTEVPLTHKGKTNAGPPELTV